MEDRLTRNITDRIAALNSEIAAERAARVRPCTCGHVRGYHFESVAHCIEHECNCCSFEDAIEAAHRDMSPRFAAAYGNTVRFAEGK